MGRLGDTTVVFCFEWPSGANIPLHFFCGGHKNRSAELGSHCGLGVILVGPPLGSGCHLQGPLSTHDVSALVTVHPSSHSSLGRPLVCLTASLAWGVGRIGKGKNIKRETKRSVTSKPIAEVAFLYQALFWALGLQL